ncbi:MAG: cyclic nucleotide-binding domain-containing protein, partial [Castellaniella sp.]
MPLFNELPPEELQPIVAGTTEIKVARDEVIFQRGDPCVGFHVVMYGLVKLLFVSSSGAERV